MFVRADNLLNASRWYTGAGIYRDVFLRTGPSVHVVPWSLRADALMQKGKQTLVRFQADVAGAADAAAWFELHQSGQMLHHVSCMAVNDHLQTEVWLEADLWSPEEPHLCTVTCILQQSGDREEIVTGLRHLAWDAQHGLTINGQTVTLCGGWRVAIWRPLVQAHPSQLPVMPMIPSPCMRDGSCWHSPQGKLKPLPSALSVAAKPLH